MLFSIYEIMDIIVMIAALGVIFSTILRRAKPHQHYNPLETKTGFDWKTFKFAILLTAPAILLHELGHKFVAVGFGLQAEFHAAYLWLVIGLVLALMRSGFIFFVPAYVSIINPAGQAISPLVYSATAFAGPAINLILWLLSWFLLKRNLVKKRHFPLIHLTKQINMFLFIFNMLPIPGFDGFQVYRGIIQTIF